MSWHILGDRATHLLIQERARPLQALERSSAEHRSCPQGAHQAQGPHHTASCGAAKRRGAREHREPSTGFIVSHSPGKAGPPSPCQSTTTHCPNSRFPQAPGPSRNCPPLPPPPRCSGPAPRRLAFCVPLTLSWPPAPRKQLTETGPVGVLSPARRRGVPATCRTAERPPTNGSLRRRAPP